MGFKRPRYTITFPPGHTLHGFEVQTRSLAFDKIMDIQGALASLPDTDEGFAELSKDDQSSIMDRIAESFADALISWNLEEDDGAPVPTTAEALKREDFTLVLSVVMKWINLVSDVDVDLKKDFDGGPPSGVESIPMDVLSPSP